jgi:DNA-binding transcriptional LysR family regulator
MILYAALGVLNIAIVAIFCSFLPDYQPVFFAVFTCLLYLAEIFVIGWRRASLSRVQPAKSIHGLLSEEGSIVLKNSKSPVAKRKRLSIKDIADQPFILTERGMGYRKFFDKEIAEKSIDITPVLEIGRTDIITKLLEENEECISYLPSFVVEKIFQCYKEN